MQRERLEQLFDFLKKNPDDSFIRFAIALEYIKRKEDQKALEYFIELLQNNPDYSATYYHLGKLYERIGQKKNAEDIYQEGVKKTQAKGDQHSYSELQQALRLLHEND